MGKKEIDLEQIPEMELLAGNNGVPISKRTMTAKKPYNSRIVIIQDPSGGYHLFGDKRRATHLGILTSFAREYLGDADGFLNGKWISDKYPGWKINSGAHIFTSPDKIHVHGTSRYDLYEEEVVRPIVERFRDERFPDISKLIFDYAESP